jgi:hypothetical protein
MQNGYLARHTDRVALARLKRQVVFGMVASSLLLGIGIWRGIVVVESDEALWATLWSASAGLGQAGLVAALVLPSLWAKPEKAVTGIVHFLGGMAFAAVLALVYLLLVVPVGLALRRGRGTRPIYLWNRNVPAQMEGWSAKEVVFEIDEGEPGKSGLFKRFRRVLQFFVSRGHLLFLPMLVIVIALGMALFFVKSSALAPFIYTLF